MNPEKYIGNARWIESLYNKTNLLFNCQVWFSNRRAKWRRNKNIMNLQAMRQSSVFGGYCHLCHDYELPGRSCQSSLRGLEAPLSYNPPHCESCGRFEGHFRALPGTIKDTSSPEYGVRELAR